MSSFALISVPVACGLAFIPHFVKVIFLTANSSYDNKDPRALNNQTKTLSPSSSAFVTRLTSAHVNQLEMLGMYAAGIAAGTAVGVSPNTMTQIAGLYIAARIGYVIAYAAPQVGNGALRTIAFGGAIGATLWAWFEAAGKVATGV